MIRYLTKAQIAYLNKETIRIHGGHYISPYNFLHEENLDYLIDLFRPNYLAALCIPIYLIKQRCIVITLFATIFFQMVIKGQD